MPHRIFIFLGCTLVAILITGLTAPLFERTTYGCARCQSKRVDSDYTVSKSSVVILSKSYHALLKHEPKHKHNWKPIQHISNSLLTDKPQTKILYITHFKDEMLASYFNLSSKTAIDQFYRHLEKGDLSSFNKAYGIMRSTIDEAHLKNVANRKTESLLDPL